MWEQISECTFDVICGVFHVWCFSIFLQCIDVGTVVRFSLDQCIPCVCVFVDVCALFRSSIYGSSYSDMHDTESQLSYVDETQRTEKIRY